MADSAKGTISATIKAYKDGNTDDVLKEFHTDARIVGTKKGERWNKKSAARTQLQKDLDTYTVGGTFTSENIKSAELFRLGDGAMLFHRVGSVTFTKGNQQDTVPARWTVVLKKYADGWKIRHSNFSLDEGGKIRA